MDAPWDIYSSPTLKAGGTLRKKGRKDYRSQRLGRNAKKQGLLDRMPLSSGNHCSRHDSHKWGRYFMRPHSSLRVYEEKPGLQINPALDSVLVLQRIKI